MTEMQVVRGIYLPAADKHMPRHMKNPENPIIMGKATYQWRKLIASMQSVHEFRHAIDVGAHVGLWSRVLALLFARVTAFEPLAIHRECFNKNMVWTGPCEIKLIDAALGRAPNIARMNYVEASSGMSHISTTNKAPGEIARIVPLDMLGLTDVDFIKIDVEGYELDVLLGGEQTIRRDKPTVIVEQKHTERFGGEAVGLLAKWGAEKKWELGGDHLFRWKTR